MNEPRQIKKDKKEDKNLIYFINNLWIKHVHIKITKFMQNIEEWEYDPSKITDLVVTLLHS